MTPPRKRSEPSAALIDRLRGPQAESASPDPGAALATLPKDRSKRPRQLSVLVDREIYKRINQLRVDWSEEADHEVTMTEIVRALLGQLERDPLLRQRIGNEVTQ